MNNEADIIQSSIYFARSLFITIALTCLLPHDSAAQDEKNYLALSTAIFDILQQDHLAFEGRLELRMNQVDWFVKPLGGIMANTDGAIHTFLGIFIEVPVTSYLFLSPSFAPGIYYKGNSKDLDFLLEFRSQFEITFKLTSGTKFGVSFNHISNASLGETNPGVESLAISYFFPLN